MAPGSPSTVILYWRYCRSRIRFRMCQSCKGVRCLGDVRSLGHSWTQRDSRCGTVPPSVLKLPVDTGHRPKYQRQRSLVDSAPALSRSIYRLWCARESVQLANRRIDPGLPTLCVSDRKWDRRVALETIFTAARYTSTHSMPE
jgi:hypothetical protein